MDATVIAFDEFELDLARFELRRASERVHIEPRALDVLVHLVANRHRVVGKVELLEVVWGSRFVTESALTTSLKAVRRALGDSGLDQRYIRTIHRRGYLFCGTVCLEPDADTVRGTLSPSAAGEHEEIRSCRAPDGTRIAYVLRGSGEVLVKAGNWLTHLDHDRSSPLWAHWLEGLSEGRNLVRYDERGSGLSQRDVPLLTFEDLVGDLATLVDALGVDRFPLIGISRGGPVAVAYAATHPERVSRLVLVGASVRGARLRAMTELEAREAELELEVARLGWEHKDPSYLHMFAVQLLPDGSADEWREFVELARATTSATNAARLLTVFSGLDVTELASRIVCPTLVLHSRRDVRVPAAQALELAALVPDSRVALLESANHLLIGNEPAWEDCLSLVKRFLG